MQSSARLCQGSTTEWETINFPIEDPALTKEQIVYFDTWRRQITKRMDAESQKTTDIPQQFKIQCRLFSDIMYEGSRLVFASCPSTANLLETLTQAILNIIQRVETSVRDNLLNIQQEIQQAETTLATLEYKESIGLQRHRNTQARLTRQHFLVNTRRSATLKEKNALNTRLELNLRLVNAFDELLLLLYDMLTSTDDDLLPTTEPNEIISKMSCIQIGRHDDVLMRKLLSQAAMEWMNRRREQARKPRLKTVKCSLRELTEGQVLNHEQIETMKASLQDLQKDVEILKETRPSVCDGEWDMKYLIENGPPLPEIDMIQILEQRTRELTKRVENHLNVRRFTEIATQTDRSYCSTRATYLKMRLHGRRKASTSDCSILKTIELWKKSQGQNDQVPSQFRAHVRRLPPMYTPTLLQIRVVHATISLIFSDIAASMVDETVTLSEEFFTRDTIMNHIYKVFLNRFHVPVFANSKLCDFITSVRQFDTQSIKVMVFSRLLQLPGVHPVPPRAFWFIVDFLRVAMSSSPQSGSFSLDDEGCETISQMKASQTLAVAFEEFPNETQLKWEDKLNHLANIGGALHIPLYSLVSIALDEYVAEYRRMTIELELEMSSRFEAKELTFPLVYEAIQYFNPTIPNFLGAATYRKIIQCSQNKADPSIVAQIFIEQNLIPIEDQMMFNHRLAVSEKATTEENSADMMKQSLVYLKFIWSQARTKEFEHLATESTAIRLVQDLERCLGQEKNSLASWSLFQHLLHTCYSSRRYI